MTVLGLTGCTSAFGKKSSNTAAPTAPNRTSNITPATTQLPPTPTQPPITSPVAGYLDPNRWKGRTIQVVTPGVGAYVEALKTAFFEPFAKATGAAVQHESYGRDGFDGVKGQVDQNNVVWDVMLIPMDAVLGLARANYLTPIDYNVVDPHALYPQLTLQHGAAAALYSTVMVFTASAQDRPDDWTDFWRLGEYGKGRALARSPQGTLEFALLADGVPMSKLYPLDSARAFRSLDKIRTATIFYEDSKQPVELVRTGQVGLASAWTVRTQLPDVASLVSVQWQGGMITADAWVVPRGGRNLEVAMSFINFATRAVPSANFTRLQPFGPVNKDSLALLRPDVVNGLPNAPQNIGQQFFQDFGYWADNAKRLADQFTYWILHPTGTPAAT
jgi:putative spermidine/putrescine transport system substrate-binding protein